MRNRNKRKKDEEKGPLKAAIYVRVSTARKPSTARHRCAKTPRLLGTPHLDLGPVLDGIVRVGDDLLAHGEG